MLRALVMTVLVATATTEIGDASIVRALGEVSLDYDAMAESRTRFDVRMTASGQGAAAQSSLVLTTIVEPGRVVLQDEWDILGRSFSVTQICGRAGMLPLERGSWAVTRKGSTRTVELVVRDGMAVDPSTERGQRVAYPEGTVNQAALFRLVPQLPRTAGVSYVFGSYSEAIQVEARQAERGAPFHVNCVGPETIERGGRSIPCTLYTLHERRAVDYYVDASGRLQRVVADGGQTVLDRR